MAIIEPFKFTVVTDIHNHDDLGADDNFNKICVAIKKHTTGAGDFIVHTGDAANPTTGYPSVGDPNTENIPWDIRTRVDEHFGDTFRYIPVLGNHCIYNDLVASGLGASHQWIKDEFYDAPHNMLSGTSSRESISDYAHPGPGPCRDTQFYFFHKGIMFIIMNWYWDGTSTANADRGVYDDNNDFTGGMIVDAQLTWLTDIFNRYWSYPKIVFGHGNAFSYSSRHSDESGLAGSNRSNRDKFWRLLERSNGIAYIHGHTHDKVIGYVDNNYSSGGSVSDWWTYGKSRIPYVCAGQTRPAFSYPNNQPSFLEVKVTSEDVILDIYERNADTGEWSVVISGDVPIPTTDEYGSAYKGGTWYYTNNKFGTEWFDKADNNKGWTVDFNLRVADVQNIDEILDEDKKTKGVGVYVNDGTKQEEINFLPQEIIFSNAGKSIVYDTTGENDYRLIGKEENLKLYARTYGDALYTELASIEFLKKATKNGNGLKPSVFEDANGNIHVVWHSDGNGIGEIYYSKYSSSEWSDPECILDFDYGSQFADIVVASNGTVYVVYESKEDDGSVIGLVYKNSIGWSKPYYTGVGIGNCKYPKVVFDSRSNPCVAWEDDRDIHPQIYLDIFSKEDLGWKGKKKISSGGYGCYHPSITSYMDDLFITWTQKSEDNSTHIEIAKYNAVSGNMSAIQQVDGEGYRPDFSNVLVNVAGKVFVVWHNNIWGEYKIYAKILSLSLAVIETSKVVVDGYGGAICPVLSEQISTGNIYIVWQDFKEGYTVDVPITDPSDTPLVLTQNPLNSRLYSSAYVDGQFLCSGCGSFDVFISFNDERNCYFPSVPPFFSGELPILYQSMLIDEYRFLSNVDLLSQIKCVFYNLSRGATSVVPNYAADDEEYGVSRDVLLNKDQATKEIRFGDFSNVNNVHYIFKNFKYYTHDAVEPFFIKDITSSDYSSLSKFSAMDAMINNYGDVWMVGTCGILFYIDRQSKVISLGKENEIPALLNNNGDPVDDTDEIKKFRSISFDTYGNMYLGGQYGIRYAINHIEGFKQLLKSSEYVNDDVLCMVFDKENNLFVGTPNGIKIYTISYDSSGTPLASDFISSSSNVPSSYITSLKVDDNNCVWMGTRDKGIYRYYKNAFFNFTINDGLSSNIVNDIAIRNTAIRYVATSNGINKMIGFGFDSDIILSDNNDIWNNNVKSILWKEPNVIIAGTLSKINQILVDDIDETYSSLIYEPSEAVINKDDFRTYYIISQNDTVISDEDVVDVYINGALILHDAYDLGYDKITDPQNPRRIIRFKTSLNHNDIVEVIVRKDLIKISTFEQTSSDKIQSGVSEIRIKDFVIDDTDPTNPKLYTSVTGDEREVKVNDSDSLLPFDKVHLDTVAPTFIEGDSSGIHIGEQIDKNIVQVNIIGATDGETGSGVDRMVISNYSNFTTDGFVSQSPVPFSTSVNHNLGATLENVMTQYTFSNGSGNKISYFQDVNELYASTSFPAIVYKYNWEETEWEEVYSYGEGYSVDFITKYNDKLMIGVGHPTRAARIYIYNYLYSTGTVVQSITYSGVLAASESRLFCVYELNGKLYIGAGIGDGNEYSEGSGTGGSVYVYDDQVAQNSGGRLTRIIEGIDDNVYSLTSIEGSNNLLAATGEDGFIYEIDIENASAFIVYNNDESVISINFCKIGEKGFVFAGGKARGIIRRSSTDNNSYDISFRTIPSRINTLKVFSEIVEGSSLNRLYAAVGNVIYYLSEKGSWVWKYTNNEEVEDIAFNPSSGVLYIISASKITIINPLTETKTVYLKLIDRAGNESVLDLNASVGNNKFMDSIEISDLVDFINENRILELDSLGNTLYTLRGNNKFYSAGKIEQEKGTYISEIFNGTNDLVKWDNISWSATELHNTSVFVYVRTSSSENDILITDWVGPFENSYSSGVDLSSLYGQYLQFKAELISSSKGISPSFHRASIRAITSEAVHFFTTNFVMPSRIQKGIITSQKVIPVSADIVFGLNTTNSVEWADYQEVDENRIFNINQLGENLRVGIKLISPNRSLIESTGFDEYGPYNSELYVNTISFDVTNNIGTTANYHFKVTLYADVDLTEEVFSAYSANSSEGFNADGEMIPTGGVSLLNGEATEVLFTVPGSANLTCNAYYFVKIEYIYDDVFHVVSDDRSFVASCSASFVDVIDFDFINNEAISNYYHFRIKFYTNMERTIEYNTQFSGNDRSGWFVDDIQVPEAGALVGAGETVNIVYRPSSDDFDTNINYYLTIEAHDGSSYVFKDDSYTFQLRDVQTTEFCGGYSDVPIVNNFGLMIELEENEFVTLNI